MLAWNQRFLTWKGLPCWLPRCHLCSNKQWDRGLLDGNKGSKPATAYSRPWKHFPDISPCRDVKVEQGNTIMENRSSSEHTCLEGNFMEGGVHERVRCNYCNSKSLYESAEYSAATTVALLVPHNFLLWTCHRDAWAVKWNCIEEAFMSSSVSNRAAAIAGI